MATGWAAARLRLRSEVRTRRAGLALLVVVIAVSAGISMAAVAGARRSDSAYPRFLAWAKVYDISVSGCRETAASAGALGKECTDDEAARAMDRVRALPFVEDSAEYGFIAMTPELADGTQPSFLAFSPVIDVDGRFGRATPRVKLLHGRLPDPAAADEVAIGMLTTERFHLSVGDVLQGRAMGAPPIDLGPLRIVGIFAAPGELPSATGAQSSSLILTRAFGRTHQISSTPPTEGWHSVSGWVRPGTKPTPPSGPSVSTSTTRPT
jgi:hypothetical protein